MRKKRAELESEMHFFHVCMQFLQCINTRKKLLHLLFASIISYNFPLCGSQLLGHLKHNLYAFQSLFPCNFQFNEWKFMHMKTSNNSSNQSDFNKRFFAFLLLRRFLCASFFLQQRRKKSFGGFWWQKEICDDVHLIKQLSKAEHSTFFFVSFHLQKKETQKDVS